MHDESDVRPIDAHAERHRRDDDVDLFVEKRLLMPAPDIVFQARVVRNRPQSRLLQPGCKLFDFAARRTVNDARFLIVASENVGQLTMKVGSTQHTVGKVRPIERSDEL
jgi:hypothetical protein